MPRRSRPQQIPQRRRFESLPSALFGGVLGARKKRMEESAAAKRAQGNDPSRGLAIDVLRKY
jgi:hypothetical protein